jgi:protein O-mannosyl-transferase
MSDSAKTQSSLEDLVRWRNWLIPIFVGLLTFLVFLPALRAGFVNWDDTENILQNQHYRGLGWMQLRWMFTDLSMGHYQPVSWLSLGLDFVLWGMNPFGYHLTSLFFHCVNAVIFYFVALRLMSLALDKPQGSKELSFQVAAGFGALLFSLHPLRVETVAWITERRGLVAGLFFLLSIYCYLRGSVVSKLGNKRALWITASVITYGLSLLSKASGIALPAVFLVLDVYPLRRLRGGFRDWLSDKNRHVWLEKAPYFFLALVTVIATMTAEHQAEAVKTRGEYGFVLAIAQIFFGLAFYPWKTLVPVGLSPLYSVVDDAVPAYWPILPSAEAVLAISIIAVLAISITLLVLRHRWPAAWAAWVSYALVLAPVLGFIQIGVQIVADRYSYLASLSWAVLASGWLLHRWQSTSADQGKKRRFVIGSMTVLLVVLGVLSWRQTVIWHDSEILWRHALAIIRESPITHNNLGAALYEKGDWEEALEHSEKAVQIDPEIENNRNNLTKTLISLGRDRVDHGKLDDAIQYFNRAVNIAPSDAEAHNYLGIALAMHNELEAATQHFRRAIELQPDRSDIRFNLGNVLAKQGNLDESAEHFREALKIRPDYAEAYNSLGRVMAARGQLERAIDYFRKAVAIRPDYAEAHESLARALAQQGKRDEAVQHFQEAVRILKARGAGASIRN